MAHRDRHRLNLEPRSRLRLQSVCVFLLLVTAVDVVVSTVRDDSS